MTNYFSTDELDEMRAAQDGHMMDECVVLVYAEGTRNEFNEDDAATYTAGSALACGLNMQPGSQRHEATMTVIEYDATIRLPIDTALKETDRVQVTKRFGESIDALTFDVMAPIQRGPSGLRVFLRKMVV